MPPRWPRRSAPKHETIEVDERMVWQHLPEIVACMDDPAADYAIIPTWFLARRARQDVKVVLSGEGGDEIFAGYPRYQSAMKPWWRGGRAMWARGSFDRVDVLRVAPVDLARRHCRGRGCGGRRRAFPPGGGAGDRHDRLAAARPAAEAGPLHDGACGGGADAVPRSRRGQGGVPSAGWDEAARRAGQVDPAQMAGEAPADGAAIRAEAGLHGAGRRMDQGAGVAARPARGGAAGGCRDRRSGQGPAAVRRTSAAGGTASPAGSCCSTRCGTGGTSLDCRRSGDVFETLAAV